MRDRVLNFWFEELQPKNWFEKSNDLDEDIKTRFLETYKAAFAGELFFWRDTAKGRLAEIIVLDQFARNIFRDQGQAFAGDSLALVLAQEAVHNASDNELSTTEKSFLYMPYMHSESKLIHEQAVKLFSQPGLEFNLDFELKHKKIIDQFGRYPHRNDLLGRESTKEEMDFLKQPGSSF